MYHFYVCDDESFDASLDEYECIKFREFRYIVLRVVIVDFGGGAGWKENKLFTKLCASGATF